MSLTVNVSGAEHIGKRENQEDFYLIKSEKSGGGRDSVTSAAECLAVVCDGMGGHASGEIASSQCCVAFVGEFRNSLENGDNTPLALYKALEVGNAKVGDWVRTHPSSSGMGCTLIAAYFNGGALHWVSVGDSLLFLLRDQKLTRLNADHSYFGVLKERVEAGEISEVEARQDPRKNQLLAAVMGDELFMVDLQSSPYALLAGDQLLLASDGIETLSDEEIAAILLSSPSEEPSSVVDMLIEKVNAAGHRNQDNTTAIHISVN